jgi:hypothetical protein
MIALRQVQDDDLSVSNYFKLNLKLDYSNTFS